MMNTKLLVGWFFLVALGLAGWWGWIAVDPAAGTGLFLEGTPEPVMLSFLLPDMVGFVFGPIVAAVALLQQRRSARAIAWFVVGAQGYGALYCLCLSLLSDAAWVGTGVLMPIFVLGLILVPLCLGRSGSAMAPTAG